MVKSTPSVWLDTTKRTSQTAYEKRGDKQRTYNNHTMGTYAWVANQCFKQKVLDVGCGKGDGMHILSIFTNELWGIDINKKELAAAIKHNFYCPVKILQMNVDKEWFSDREVFDTVLCLETLEHLNYPEFLVKNVAQICNKFIFSVPHNAPAPYHTKVFVNLAQIKAIVEPYFNVKWYFERKNIISSKPFEVPHRYIGVGTPI